MISEGLIEIVILIDNIEGLIRIDRFLKFRVCKEIILVESRSINITISNFKFKFIDINNRGILIADVIE